MEILVIAFFAWTAFDRLKSTFGTASFRERDVKRAEKLNTALMTAVYIFIALLGFFSILTSGVTPGPTLVACGMVVYLTARRLRNSAIRALGTSWNIHVTANSGAHVVTDGPYRYTRHPYYSAALLELVSYAILFRSWPTFLLAVLVFLPLSLFLRVRLEERDLGKKFPREYSRYKKDVPLIFSLGKFLAEIFR